MQLGFVYLVGAGCGEADLITVRGLSALRRCQVVVYDDLIDRALLAEAPSGAEKLYMGKRSGSHSAAEAEICAALIQKAREGKTVVRLKGGDPFVFGRGGEEALALQSARIPYEVVPGISSAIAIPELAGIPVTHRSVSQSFHVITGHTADTPDGLPACFDGLARLPGTLVFLMGLGRLSEIVRRLIAAGMPGSTPAAVVSGGNAPCPAAVRATLAELEARVRSAGVRPPAVIVVGAAAALELSSTAVKSLQGVKVGVTGTPAVTGKLRNLLQEDGAQVFLAGGAETEPLPCPLALETLCDGGTHWLVFTSSNGVQRFFEEISAQNMDLRRLSACRIAVIGASTGAALSRRGLLPDLCPETYTSQALGEKLLQTLRPGEDVVLFRSRRGSRPLFETLARRFPVRDIPLYDLTPDRQSYAQAQDRLSEADYLTFSSASGVEFFFEFHGAIPDRAVCVCIGGVTADALRRRYQKPFLTAADISVEGICQAIRGHLAGRRATAGT